MASLKNNTTFNRGNSKGQINGFYSRALFGYIVGENPINVGGDNDWTTGLNFDGMDWLMTNYEELVKGSNRLPPKYWLLGKTIRVSGEAIVTGTDGAGEAKFLNMRFGIKEQTTPNTTWLAVQNNENNHIFVSVNYDNLQEVPISFRCIITCPYYDENADPPNIYFMSNGYMHYDRSNWITAGPNNDRTYVPLWKGNAAIPVTDTYYTSETSIMFNFYGSTVQSIFLTRLLVEELA